MLNIGLIVLLSIDFLLLFIGRIIFYLHTFKVFNFRDFIEKIQDAIPSKNKNEDLVDNLNEAIDDIEEKKRTFIYSFLHIIKYSVLFVLRLIGKFTIIGFVIAIIILCIGIPTASIWGTILIAIHFGVLYAILFLFVMKFISFLLGLCLFKLAKVDKKRTQRVLIMDAIQFTMLSLLVFLVAFGYPVDMSNMIVIPFEWNIVLNNLLSIVIPMLFYALIITNIFALFIRFKNIFTKDINKHRIIRLHQLLFIFITSCFFGILYLTDIDFSFMNELERTMYLQTLEVVKWIVTSAFIPLFLYTLNNFKKTKTVIQRPRRRTSSHM